MSNEFLTGKKDACGGNHQKDKGDYVYCSFCTQIVTQKVITEYEENPEKYLIFVLKKQKL